MVRFPPTRRAVLRALGASAAARALPGFAQGATSTGSGQAWPSKPVRIVVPYPAGGPADGIARVVGQKLAAAWGQGVVIDNRPGANANIGAEAVARAPNDGHTLLVGTASTHGINPAIYPRLGFDPVKDFVPVVQLTDSTLYLAVAPNFPAANLQEFLRYAKANPGKLNYGSPGIGSAHHLAGELLKLRAGLDMTHVAYKGSGPARQALLGGELQLLWDSAIMPLARAGQVRVLGSTSAQRWPSSPEVPTFLEQGVADFTVSGWFALFAPAGTPPAVVQKVNADTNRVLADPELQERAKAFSVVVQGGSAKDLEQLVARELARWPAVVKASGAKFDS